MTPKQSVSALLGGRWRSRSLPFLLGSLVNFDHTLIPSVFASNDGVCLSVGEGSSLVKEN